MFKNCIIKARGVNPHGYHSSNGERGTKDFIMSPSSLKKFAECPAEWMAEAALLKELRAKLVKAERHDERRFWQRKIDELEGDSAEKGWGRLVDARLFTPESFNATYAVRPDEYTETVLECPSCGSITESKTCRKCKVDRVQQEIQHPWSSRATACQEWVDKQEAAGLEVIAPYTVQAADMAITRMMANPVIKKAIDCSDKQVHVVGEWHDKATGLVIPVQCLIDLVPRLDTDYVPDVEMMWPKCLGDLKTSNTADIVKFSRRVEDFGWDIQAGFDVDLYCAATGEDRDTWLFIGQKNSGSWQPFKRMLTQDFLIHGRARYQRMLGNYATCLKTGKYPDYDDNDESICGFGQAAPDQYMAMREQFAPRFLFEEEGDSEPEPEEFVSEMPT